MSPIETIKKGIINNDMEKVIEGFRLLTGEEVKQERKIEKMSRATEVASTHSEGTSSSGGTICSYSDSEEKPSVSTSTGSPSEEKSLLLSTTESTNAATTQESTDDPNLQQDTKLVRSKDLDFSTKPREDTKYSKREPIAVGENQFVDDGTEATDVKTPDVERTTRRPPVKMVEVQCHVCGEKEMLNAQYKSGEFHRCGKCVGT